MMHALLAVALAAAPQQQTTDTTFAVRPNGRLEIDNQSGRVMIRTWDENRVRIQARHGRRVELDITREGSTIHVEPEHRSGPTAVNFEITVPRSFNIEIDAISTEIDVADLNGDVTAETVNGSITLAGIAGRIAASSVEGRLTIRDTRGNLQAETVNQGIEIRNHTGDVDAETVNGALVLSGVRANVVSAETVNGGVQYEGDIREGGRYYLGTHNGTITVIVPDGTNATVSVETYNGEIESDFPISLRGQVGKGDRMTFTIGNGGARLQLESFGGIIQLRRPGNRTREPRRGGR